MTDAGNVLIRGIVGFIFLLIVVRLNGKKQITDITYFEYVAGIAIGSLAAELTFGTDIRASNFILGMLVWGLLPIMISFIDMKSYRSRLLTEGRPTFLIKNGNIMEKNLKQERMTVNELMIHLRQKNVFNISDVETAILETSGQVSVMKKSDQQPITPKDMGMVVEQEYQPRLVVIDGNLMEKSLNDYGYTKEWLLGEIEKQGAKRIADVFLAQIDSTGNVYVDLYQDRLKMPQIKQKLLAAANIKQLQANMENFSLQTENKEAKEMYRRNAKQLENLLDELSVYLNE